HPRLLLHRLILKRHSSSSSRRPGPAPAGAPFLFPFRSTGRGAKVQREWAVKFQSATGGMARSVAARGSPADERRRRPTAKASWTVAVSTPSPIRFTRKNFTYWVGACPAAAPVKVQ